MRIWWKFISGTRQTRSWLHHPLWVQSFAFFITNFFIMQSLVRQRWLKLCSVITLFKCQKIPIPNSAKSEQNSDGHNSFDEDEEEEELMELTKVPKLHLRPKTAPCIEGRRGVRYVTWNEAQQQNGPKRPSSASKPTKHQRDLLTRVRIF